MKAIAALAASLAFLATPAVAQHGQLAQTTKAVDSVTAQAALATFRQLVSKDNFLELGFDSPEQIRSASLGMPMPEYFVRLDELRSFVPDQEPTRLLHPSGRATLFVLVDGRARASIVVAQQGQKWVPVNYGAPKYTQILDSTRARLASQVGARMEEFFEVRVLALNAAFLGHYHAGELLLTPLISDQRFGFVAGATLPAKNALLAMVAAARAHNGLPT